MSWRGAVVVIGLALLVAAGAVVAFAATYGLPWSSTDTSGPALITPSPPPAAAWESAAEVLPAAGDVEPTDDAAGSSDAVAAALAGPLAADGLGGRVGVSVIDLASDTPVYQSEAARAQTPASTLKILTAVAALDVLGPEHVFTTKVVTAGAGLEPPAAMITLVGGGDPTLTTEDGDGTSLTALAERTARALDEAGVTSVTLTYDDSLFSGPAVDPDWRPTYVSSGVVSPVTALAVDVAEDRPQDPSAAAADQFAELLRERGIDVAAQVQPDAVADDATEIASVHSGPVAAVVEDLLITSDNDVAEVLARHVALGAGLEGTAAEASTAVVRTLDELGIDMSSVTMLDGSGLARGNAVPASTIGAAVALAADSEHPQLRAAVTGLPVAGFTGTLADRIEQSPGAGNVRAKTGTLTGVSSLAGVVTSADGVRFAFAVLADDITNTFEARAALDDVAAALAGCTCGAGQAPS